MFKFSTSIRVCMAHTDAQGVVYHGEYLTFFEIGRIEYLRDLGLVYRDLLDRDIAVTVTECHCKFIAPAVYDDLLEVHVRAAELRRASFVVEYLITRNGTERITTGSTTIATVNRTSGKPIRMPDYMRKAVIDFEGDDLGLS